MSLMSGYVSQLAKGGTQMRQSLPNMKPIIWFNDQVKQKAPVSTRTPKLSLFHLEMGDYLVTTYIYSKLKGEVRFFGLMAYYYMWVI